MKLLTALFLLLPLVLPAGMVSQAVVAPLQEVCDVVDDSGHACCEPAATHCCCQAAPAPPAPPAPPQPQPVSPFCAAKDIAASLPQLLVLAELPRLSEAAAPPELFSDRARFPTAPPVRFCVMRCCLLI